ncbi:hypothetical protein CDAR_104191 [Caerostris darwini]|uniref:Uncharacterized protein n=1 Tax=Caerostris darwini TaxID=1538125 RepID=A0AAV4QX22_9ARAC|nr:hypothetical protein CDAR_104191 [Caerostris darwini]
MKLINPKNIIQKQNFTNSGLQIFPLHYFQQQMDEQNSLHIVVHPDDPPYINTAAPFAILSPECRRTQMMIKKDSTLCTLKDPFRDVERTMQQRCQ